VLVVVVENSISMMVIIGLEPLFMDMQPKEKQVSNEQEKSKLIHPLVANVAVVN
jgi:hypothetical protein